jgi:hypothetical protein
MFSNSPNKQLQHLLTKTNSISRQSALKRYYSNPNLCIECGKVIHVPESGTVPPTRKKKFCNKSCAASYNNRGRRHGPKPKPKTCPVCDGPHYNKRIYCSVSCLRSKTRAVLQTTTKGELFQQRKSWQAARSCIQNNARKVYEESRKPKVCFVCGYANHYEVAHIQSVSSFPDSVTVGKINSLSNLLALCPNHHWEFDHGLINELRSQAALREL